MSGPKFIAAILCAGVLGGWCAYVLRQGVIDDLAARNTTLQKQLQQAQADGQTALAKVAGNETEMQNLRQDSMALARLREKLKTNAPSIDAPPGFYADPSNALYLTYSTPDPVLRSFMRSVMTGDGDSASKGQAIFQKICAACHQQDGGGKDGLAPPLNGSEWVKASSGDRLVRIVLNGLSGPVQVKGKTWALAMPPLRENLDDDQIATVLNYIRSQWADEGATPIKPELASSARQPAHPNPETADELLRISLK
jgi:mono/diheme cytochrome c family protein